MNAVPVLVVSAIDSDLLTATTTTLLHGQPQALTVRYRHNAMTGVLRRSVSGGTGAADVNTVGAASCCLSCAVRADVAALLPTLIEDGPAAVIVCLPAAMDPVPVAGAIRELEEHAGLYLAALLVAISPATLRADLFGTDLLTDRQLAVAATDRRSVGEVLARQLETSDVVVLANGTTRTSDALLEHLVGRERLRLPWSTLAGATGALRLRRSTAIDRADLRAVAPTGAADAAGVWTLDLSTWKPFHPERLLDGIGKLGGGPLRGRGIFWLASRPSTRCGWDGAGGQLSVGPVDAWDRPAFTRLVITGTGRHPTRVRRAFEKALLTDRELALGLKHWLPVDGDGWEAWLGPCGENAFTGHDLER